MARIKIRGRLEPIEMDNARAQKVKNRKFGLNGEQKAEAIDTVDLGDWAGEYGRIVEIEMTKEVNNNQSVDNRAIEEEAERKKWLALSPEAKAGALGRFKLSYAMRSGNYSAEPPAELLEKAKKILLKFFTENPTALSYGNELDELLPQKKAHSLAESMDMNKTLETNGRKCKKCGTDLTANKKEYCSGKCQLDDKNGELSTE